MRAFLIKGQSLEAKATYNETELLCALDINEVRGSELYYDYQVLKGFLKWLPTNLSDLETAMTQPGNTIKVTEIAPDLSFQAFWDLYDYKVGNRSRAEAVWKKLSTADKNACMLGVRRYKNWLKTQSIGHAYAETFLSQRRWENEYKIK